MPWNYRKFGTRSDPIHKSDLVEITGGDFGCPRRFRFARDERADGVTREQSNVVHAKTAAGSAVHETLARALNNPDVRERVLAGPGNVRAERVRATFEHEFELACDGREVEWGKDKPVELIDDRVAMLLGALNSLHARVAEVVMVEAGFTVMLEGVHLAGHTDLVYRPKHAPDELALADWKTGMQKPDTLELDHGWESGIYSLALRDGVFLPRECVQLSATSNGGWSGQYVDEPSFGPVAQRATRWQAERDALEAALELAAGGVRYASERRFGQFPASIHVVHLHDYVPYVKAGKKEVKRPEDCDHYGCPPGTTVRTAAGDTRGPAWLPVRRGENDVPRLAYRLRTVVGTVRMGRFLDLVGERCKRCTYARECLNGGYAPRGDELVELEARLKAAGL